MNTISMRFLVTAIASVVVAVLVGSAAEPASATFPGANGKIAFVRTTDLGPVGDIWVMDPDGRNQTRLTSTGRASAPAWSADGTRIAYAQRSAKTGTNDVWIMNADGTGARRVTRNVASDSQPAWSPDGRWLAFTSNRSGHGEIYRIRSTRPYGTPIRLTFTEQPSTDDGFTINAMPAWSPDGRRIAFSRVWGSSTYAGAEVVKLGIMRADGTRTRVKNRYTSEGRMLYAAGPSWGPGGRYLAWAHDRVYVEDPPTNVYRSTPLGSTALEVTRYPESEHGDTCCLGGPTWSPWYGKWIVYSLTPYGATAPAIYRIASNGTGTPTLVARNAQDPDWGVAPS